MEKLIEAGLEVLQSVVMVEAGTFEFYALVAIGAAAMLLLMNVIGRVCGIANRGLVRRVIGAVIGLGTAFLAVGAAQLYVLPLVSDASIKLALLIAVPVAGLAVVAVPLMMVVFRASYSSVLFMFLFCIITCILLVMLMTSVLDAVDSGDRHSQGLRRSRDAVDEVIRR